MRPYRLMNRSSTLSNAFAQALAPVGEFDETRFETAFQEMGLVEVNGLTCVYCGKRAGSVDHLNPLVKNSKFTGWGHVFGNLVPACAACNQSKGGKPWRAYAREVGMSEDLFGKLERYERQAPVPVSQDDLAKLYPDLMDAYDSLRSLSIDTLRTAQSLANELRRLELLRNGK